MTDDRDDKSGTEVTDDFGCTPATKTMAPETAESGINPQCGIRPMLKREHRRFYRLITQDFPLGEYPPYFVLHRQLCDGDLEGLVFSSEDDKDLAYSLNASGHANGWVLVSLFAVLKERRGVGTGSAFLAGMADRYRERQCLVVEVEKVEEARTEEERDIRERRIRFYERAGFRIAPGISYAIWGVPMHLMLKPLGSSFEELLPELPGRIREVYLMLMGKTFIHQMVLKVL